MSRISIWKIKKNFKKYGDDGLKNHKSGRLTEPVSQKFFDKVDEEWKKNKCGARKLHVILKKQGFCVSLRKISRVMVEKGLQKPCINRRKPRKYKRYERPIPNILWHTDYHTIKSNKLQGKEFISYIDDCSRKIMGYGVFDNQTTENALGVLYCAIVKHSVVPMELNSDRGVQFISPKLDKNGEANHLFQQSLKELNILFIPSKRRHPQTNGKLEKFHHILDTGFDERFEKIDEFIEWYNDERLSEAVDYMTPNDAYKKRL